MVPRENKNRLTCMQNLGGQKGYNDIFRFGQLQRCNYFRQSFKNCSIIICKFDSFIIHETDIYSGNSTFRLHV